MLLSKGKLCKGAMREVKRRRFLRREVQSAKFPTEESQLSCFDEKLKGRFQNS